MTLGKLKRLARRVDLARVFCLALLVTFAAVRLLDPPPLEEVRARMFDLFQTVQPRVSDEHPVVIVDIDEKSLAEYGQWPWPRTRLADLVTALTGLDAAVIGFDAVFAEQDRLSPAVAAQGFHGLDDVTRLKLLALPSNDRVFADAIERSKVVLGETALAIAGPPDATPRLPVGLVTLGEDPKQFLPRFPRMLRNTPVLSDAASGHGLLTLKSERDGIVRRVPMLLDVQDEIVPALTLEMLRVVAGADTLLIKTDPTGIKSVAFKGFEIPTDRDGQLWVHFNRHDPGRFVSAADVLQGRISPEAVSRRLVLIGTSAAGLLDSKTTPVEATMPGVEVHAQILESILTGSILSRPGYAIAIELAIALLLGLVVIWLTPLLHPVALLVFAGVIAAGLIGMPWYFYLTQNLMFDFSYPLLSTVAIGLTLMFSSYVREQSQRRQIRSAFGRYLSPALVEQLAHSPEKLMLGGEEREMTIMFSDVRGFTAISETYRHDPQGLTTLMNRLLTPLTDAILDHHGTIDKYMGDAVMAFWNAPLDDKAHQCNACDAALDMLERITVLNQVREREATEAGKTFIPLIIGIGINTGICVVGNVGSRLRFDYSVLGDSVNLAARLEGQSATYGFPIVVGAATARAAKEKFALLELDRVAVKGRKEPETVYAIAGRADMAKTENFQQLRESLDDMLAFYRARNWEGALEAISRGRGRDMHRLEVLFDLYEDRIQYFKKTPPDASWDGVTVLTQK